MAKEVSKREKKEKTPDFKDTLYGIAGQALADALDCEVLRIKVTGMPECLLVTDDAGNDFTLAITQKKTNVPYEDEDNSVKATFSPEFCEDADVAEDTENTTN